MITIYLKRFRLIEFSLAAEKHVRSLPPHVWNERVLLWRPPRQPNGWPMRFYAILCMSCPVICQVEHGEGGWLRQWRNTSLFSVLYSSIIHECVHGDIPDEVEGNTLTCDLSRMFISLCTAHHAIYCTHNSQLCDFSIVIKSNSLIIAHEKREDLLICFVWEELKSFRFQCGLFQRTMSHLVPFAS